MRYIAVSHNLPVREGENTAFEVCYARDIFVKLQWPTQEVLPCLKKYPNVLKYWDT